jgi:hypothetical protein
MPTKKKRLTFIPDLEALAVCGRDIQPDEEERWATGSESVNGVLRRHAMLIEEAGREVADMFTRGEWNMMADALHPYAGLDDGPFSAHPAGELIASNVEDSADLDGTDKKWKVNAKKLVDKIHALTPLQAEAVSDAIRWFSDHCEGIKNDRDEWWLPAFRRKAVRGK